MNKYITVLNLFLLLNLFYKISFTLSLYNQNSPVKLYNESQFKEVLATNKVYLVEFYQNWCGHCKNFAPEYEKVAKAFEGLVPVIATDDKALMSRFNVNGFPTIKLLHSQDGKTPKTFDYEGNRDPSSLISFVLKTMKSIAIGKINPNNPNQSSNTKEKSGKKEDNNAQVYDLTDSNFESTVINDLDHVWFIKFYAPWCGHCKSLAPTWEKLANSAKAPVKIGRVDATVEKNLASQYMIQGYPTLKLFPMGKKSSNNVKSYDGARSLDALLSYVNGFARSDKKVEILDSDEKFRKVCVKGVCIVSFLPRISNSDNEERKKYLDEYTTLALSSTDLPVNFLWAQGGDHYELENQLHLSFGYPAVVAFSLEKSAYIIHRGGFTKDSLSSFLNGLITGKLPFDLLPENLVPFNSIEQKIKNNKDEL